MRNFYLLTIITFLFTCVSCTSNKQLCIADDKWFYDANCATVVNSDSSFIFSFGDGIHKADIQLFYDEKHIGEHSKISDYVYGILKQANLEKVATVLLYVPDENVLFVKLPTYYKDVNPNAITSNLAASNPYTLWNWDYDNSEGQRDATEMFTNAYADKKAKRIIVVDKFTYDTTPIARISILQSPNKAISEILHNSKNWLRPCDVTDIRNIIPVSNWIDNIRGLSIENYKLGQSIKISGTK